MSLFKKKTFPFLRPKFEQTVRPGILCNCNESHQAQILLITLKWHLEALHLWQRLVCMCAHARVFSTSENEHWRGILNNPKSLLTSTPCHLLKETWEAKVLPWGWEEIKMYSILCVRGTVCLFVSFQTTGCCSVLLLVKIPHVAWKNLQSDLERIHWGKKCNQGLPSFTITSLGLPLFSLRNLFLLHPT